MSNMRHWWWSLAIIVSGGRLRFDGSMYLINDNGKPAIGIYKFKDGALKLDKVTALDKKKHKKLR